MSSRERGAERVDFVKKESKNLLKIAKASGGAIPITSLSEAQAVMARVKGYPDWHHFERSNVETEKVQPPYGKRFLSGTTQIDQSLIGHPEMQTTMVSLICGGSRGERSIMLSEELSSFDGFVCCFSDTDAKGCPSGFHPMSPSSSRMNPFDTRLGVRFPSKHEIDLMASFVVSIFGGTDYGTLLGTMRVMSTEIVELVFKKLADDAYPKPYRPGFFPDIDASVARMASEEKNLSWWAVVDFLVAQGHDNLALKAQTMATPSLSDFKQTLHELSQNSESNWCRHMTSLGKGASTISQTALRNISEFIDRNGNMWPSADIQIPDGCRKIWFHVTSSSPDFDALMSWARCCAERFLGHPAAFDMPRPDLSQFGKSEQARLLLRADARLHQRSKNMECKLVWDISLPGSFLEERVYHDMRYGRKWGIGNILSVSKPAPLSRTILEYATTICVHSEMPEDDMKRIGFDWEEYRPFQPDSHVWLLHESTKKGWFRSSFSYTLSPELLWLNPLSAEDVHLREYARTVLGDGWLGALTRRFPSGSAKDDISEKCMELPWYALDDDERDGICEEILS